MIRRIRRRRPKDAQSDSGSSRLKQQSVRLGAESPSEPGDMAMPHERDESADAGQAGTRPRIQQAEKDLEQGQQDTDRRGEAVDQFNRQTGRGPGRQGR